MVEDEVKKFAEKSTPAKSNSEALYHKMLDEIRDYAIILLDAEGYITEWNKGAEKIKGYKASEVIGKKFEIFYTEPDRQSGLPYHLLKLASMQGSVSHEGWRVRKDGTRFWGSVVITVMHDEEGKVIGFSKVTRDLTDRKKTEDDLREYAEELEIKNEELRQSEERYHKMVSEVQDYAIIMLNRNGDVEDWNTGAEYIKGYTAEEIIGKNFRIFYTPNDLEQKLPETLIDLAIRRGRAHHEGWRIRKDGTKFWGSVTITALHGTQGNIIGFSKVTRDLTERKLADDAIKKKNAELEAINKELAGINKELSSFAYISSHDLQEPLRKIQTFSTRIMELEEKNLTKRGLDYFTRIIAASQRMRSLIDDLLTYSRANSAERKFERTDLNKVLKEVINDLDTNVEEKKAVVESDSLPVIDAIPFQVYQLLFNLLMNALKFSRPAITPYILIRSGIVAAERIPGLLKRVADKYHHISVTDNGIGFSQEQSDRIFEVFQRLHGRDEYIGTGIGLAICKKIVENHYGLIRAEGRPGEGATFHIYIPTVLEFQQVPG
ncbi:MAG: PAS domain S-box protein [Bacteroidota bacterium]